MRDYVLLAVVFGALPFVLARPHIGVLLWCWLGFMNPHRLGWGLASSLPLSAYAAAVTTVGLLFSRDPKRIPWSALIAVWIAFVLWMNLATFDSMIPDNSWVEWRRTMKIQFGALLTLILINNPERLRQVIWVTAVSLGFYGVKGGIFALATGGNYIVSGPYPSFIGDNNSLALALIMVLPLIRYLHLQEKQTWVRRALLATMLLTALAIATSHSRGALIAGCAMAAYLWLRGPRKIASGAIIATAIAAILLFMPAHWFERMGTIGTYRDDPSAMGRVNAWGFAINLANDHPLTGAGFDAFKQELFDRYAPDPQDLHDAHSIYFEVLAEQGYVGLALFLVLGILALRTTTRIIRQTCEHPALAWAKDLASMLRVSLVGYAVGGAFLGLAYFDLYYHLVALIVITCTIVERQLASVPDVPGVMERMEPQSAMRHAAPGR